MSILSAGVRTGEAVAGRHSSRPEAAAVALTPAAERAMLQGLRAEVLQTNALVAGVGRTLLDERLARRLRTPGDTLSLNPWVGWACWSVCRQRKCLLSWDNCD